MIHAGIRVKVSTKEYGVYDKSGIAVAYDRDKYLSIVFDDNPDYIDSYKTGYVIQEDGRQLRRRKLFTLPRCLDTINPKLTRKNIAKEIKDSYKRRNTVYAVWINKNRHQFNHIKKAILFFRAFRQFNPQINITINRPYSFMSGCIGEYDYSKSILYYYDHNVVSAKTVHELSRD
jgi:hypothetical protein